MTARRCLWVLLGLASAVRIAVHVYGEHSDGTDGALRQGTLVAFFGGPERTVIEVLGRDSALVARFEVARGNRVRIEQAVLPADAPAYGVQVREFVGHVVIAIEALDGGVEPGNPVEQLSGTLQRGRLIVRVMDSVVRVLP